MSKLTRACDKPVVNDGSVFRQTKLALLEGQDYCFQRLHLEFAAELSGSLSTSALKFSPHLVTASDSFFKHARGKLLLLSSSSYS